MHLSPFGDRINLISVFVKILHILLTRSNIDIERSFRRIFCHLYIWQLLNSVIFSTIVKLIILVNRFMCDSSLGIELCGAVCVSAFNSIMLFQILVSILSIMDCFFLILLSRLRSKFFFIKVPSLLVLII